MHAGSKITGNVRDELRRFPVRWDSLLNLTTRRLPQVNGKQWINNGGLAPAKPDTNTPLN